MIKKTFSRYSWAATLIGSALLLSASAHAGILVSVTPSSAPAGYSGYFDVNLLNTGPLAQNIAAFSLGLSVTDPNLTFTGGDQGPALPYLFAGDSFNVNNGFFFVTVPPPNGLNVQASDLSDSGAGSSVGSGVTVGLGRFYFDISPLAPQGTVTVTVSTGCLISDACTSFADFNGEDIPFTTADGTVTVTPEPSTLALSLFAVSAFAWRRVRR